jgi:hypothetical protein
MINDLIKDYLAKQMHYVCRPGAKRVSSDGIELEVRKEDLGIGVDMLGGADEAVVLVFVGDDPSNCEVDARFAHLKQMDLRVGCDFGA